MTPFRRPVTYVYLLIGALIVGIVFYIQSSILRFEETSSRIREGFLLESSRSIAKMIGILISDRQSAPPSALDVGKLLMDASRDFADPLEAVVSEGTMRVRVIDLQGQVAYDSDVSGPTGEILKHSGFDLALKGQIGRDVLQDSSGIDWITVTCPILYRGHILGAVSSSRSNATIRPALDEIEHGYLMVGIAFGLLSILLVLALFVYFLRPIELWFAYSDLFRGENITAMPNLRKLRLGLLGRFVNRVLDVLSDHRHVEQMMYCLAHELRAPLASIHARAELIQRGVDARVVAESVLEILRSTQRMRATIDRLLKIAALEQRNTLKEFAPVALSSLWKEVMQETQFDAERASIRIQWLGTFNGTVYCEQTLLVEAIANLVRNAIEHSPSGASIEISTEEGEKTVEFLSLIHI